jgi:uncharacterized protein (DUF1800 family)
VEGAPESGFVQVDQTSRSQWHHVALNPPFTTTPIVVMGPLSSNDGQPATVRVSNVAPDGFDFKIDEWQYEDGRHGLEDVSYLAVEPGAFPMPGGSWYALRVPAVNSSFVAVPFPGFTSKPAVLAQIVTKNNKLQAPNSTLDRPLLARVRDVSASGCRLAIQAEKAFTSPLLGEDICMLVMSAGTGTADGFEFAAVITSPVIRDHWTAVAFPKAFASPMFLAQIQTMNSAGPVSLREKGLTSTGVNLIIEEEQSTGRNSKHSNESVGYLVLRSAGDGDADHDGMLDSWELAHGLNPNDPSDAAKDSDGDGWTNLQEFQNNTDPQVFSQGTSGGIVSLNVEVPDAFEKENLPARVRLVRTGSNEPVIITYSAGGSADPTKASASPSDYVIRDSAGQVLNGSIYLPLNVSEAVLTINPVADSINEMPETLVITLQPAANYTLGAASSATLRIIDAQNTPANDRLFVAYLGPQGASVSFGSGLSTVRLQGDNTVGTVSLSFSGLTTTEIAVHVHLINPGGAGLEAESLELGQVVNHSWTIRPVPPVTITDQQALDALFAGQYYVNVHTTKYPNGEIRGDYHLQNGSTELQVPPPPPPLEPLTGTELDRDIARFLTQATFGATTALISEVRQMITDPTIGNGDRVAGMRAWLDRQINTSLTPQTFLYDYVKAADTQEWWIYTNNPAATYYNATFEPFANNRRRGWWPLAVKANDHLRQRIAFALSEIFVVSERDSEVSNRHYGAANYYDMLGRDAFGSYRTLLQDVSLHPIMGRYLSHLKNQKQIVDSTGKVVVSPDENYGREVMQLFSVGLVQLFADGTIKLDQNGLPIPTYDQTGVTEMSRVFTGWSFSKRDDTTTQTVVDNSNFNLGNGSRYLQAQWMNPMKMFPTYHDTGSKTILGSTVLPAGQTGEQDLARALDALAGHANTAPFISRGLIQRLVTSNPSRGYVYRVAQRWVQSSGNLGEVIKALLLDYEARSLTMLDNATFGKQKEPIVRYVATLRALNAASKMPLADLVPYGYPSTELAKLPPGATVYRYSTTDNDLGQSPLRAPTVFNWFLPDYAPGGPTSAAGLVAPEFQITTESQVIAAINYHYQISYSTSGQSVSSLPIYLTTDDDVKNDLTPFLAIYDSAIAAKLTVASAVTQVVDALDQLFCSGRLKARYALAATPNPRSTIIDTVVNTSPTSTTPTSNRVRTALYLVLTTPEFVIQK